MLVQNRARAICFAATLWLLTNTCGFAQCQECSLQDGKNDKDTLQSPQKDPPMQVSLKVKVVDKGTSKGIERAQVSVTTEAGVSLVQKTDKNGIADFPDVGEGAINIQVVATGYKNITYPLNLERGADPVTIELDKATQSGTPSEKVGLKVEVVDKETSTKIRQAQVFITTEAGDLLDQKTDRKGIANFSDVGKGAVIIKVVVPGYKTYTDSLNLEQGQNSHTIKLDKDT